MSDECFHFEIPNLFLTRKMLSDQQNERTVNKPEFALEGSILAAVSGQIFI